MSWESSLPRTKGKLTAVATTYLNGSKAFVCECSCGRQKRTVLARQFDRGNVTCCEQCVEDGLKPDLHRHNPPRVNVSLDADTLALLGYDLTVKGNASGAIVRTLLREYALLVRQVALGLDWPPSQWKRLLDAAKRNGDLLEGTGGPSTQVCLLMREADIGQQELNPLQSAAVLSALRWGLNSEDEDWWNPDVRMGEQSEATTSHPNKVSDRERISDQ